MKIKNVTLARFLRSKFFIIGSISTIIIILLSIFAESIIQYDPTIPDYSSRLISPQLFSEGFKGHIFGTDSLGRDIFSRLLVGSQYTLVVAFTSVIFGAILGVILGMLAGYYGGWVNTLIMRLSDVQLSIPVLLLAITLVAVVGPNLYNLILVLIITNWPSFARLTSSSVQVLNRSEFVSASKVLGGSDIWIMFRQILPNVLTPIIVQSTLTLGTMILYEANLSFLGMGVQPPTPSWGVMIANGKESLQAAPWTALIPGMALMVTVLSFNFLGDGIRDALDPKMK